ncbi:MAG: DUF4912 domain-containing protein [Verrucomicrobiota bacterium]
MGNIESGNTPESGSGKKPAFQLSKEPVVQGKPSEDVHKYEASLTEAPLTERELPEYEDLGSLPAHYGSKALFLVARDPHWLFCYWDIDWEEYPVSRMHDGRVLLKLFNDDGAEVYSAEVNVEARNWYIPATKSSAAFYAEIGFVNQEGAWEVIARSNDASTPSDGISDDVADAFATVPYHMAFQKLLDDLHRSMEEGESLMAALSRIQSEGRKLLFALGATPEWTDDQRRVLAAMLGSDLTELLGLGSAEIDKLLRKQLIERLFSESASGLLPKGEVGAESSLSSGFAALGEVSSWSAAEQSSWISSWLSSWSGAKGEVALGSWLASWGGMSATEQKAALGSWLASWGGLSSWLASWGAPQQQEQLASWLSSWSGAQQQAAISSWLASWGGVQQQAAVSSWLASWSSAQQQLGVSSFASWSSAQQQAGLASWLSSWGGLGGGSESFWSSWLSSWSGAAPGASWSAQPFSKPREFYMHVNAEVIFYGGTHPDAKVWVDGKPIKLNADGSFHFHFTFPDGEHSVPIVAESPDGVERRSAILRFERGTTRRGQVGVTSQPTHLAPLGS